LLILREGTENMATEIVSDPVPLRLDSKGAIRVGKTRVILELVIAAFMEGASAEDIVGMFDTLDLGDVYSVIGYYLHHKDDVGEYLRERKRYSEEVWARIESRQGSQAGLRKQLLARLQSKK
jgi:uncharacterized protein (DUF433 family)